MKQTSISFLKTRHGLTAAKMAGAIVAVTAVLLPVVPSLAASQTLTVCSHCIYTTIQSGIDAAKAGDTVLVDNGNYNEKLDLVSGIKLVGQSETGVVVTPISNDFGQGLTAEGVSNVSISNLTIVANTSSGGYALKLHNGSHFKLRNLTLTGPGAASTSKIGGLDINGVSDVTLKNVSASGFSKNGVSFDTKFADGDVTTKDITLNNVSSTNNHWAGLAFYTTNSAGDVGGDIKGVSIKGTTTLTGNDAQGLFIEGDSDANLGAQKTPRYTVTGLSGSRLALGNAVFNDNGTLDVLNYQTADVRALHATFEGQTGSQRTPIELTALEQTKIIDSHDNPVLGEVRLFGPTIVVTNPVASDAYNGTIPIQANITDAVSNVRSYRVSIQSKAKDGNWKTVYSGDWTKVKPTTGSFSGLVYSWDTTNVTYPDGQYRVRVHAQDLLGNKSKADVIVNVDNTVPPTPTITFPVNGATLSIQQVTWTAVNDNPITYVYQSSLSSATNPDGSFQTPAYTSGNLTSPSILTPGTPPGTYYLHVKAVDGANVSSPWSPVVTITAQ